MKHIRGQSEAARNARLDRACCPTHGQHMGQISGWWYPVDEPPFTLVGCSRADCDVICKSQGIDGPVSDPLSEAEQRALHAEHGTRWQIEYAAHSLYDTALGEARKRRDAGALSADGYARLERGAALIKIVARRFIAALEEERGE